MKDAAEGEKKDEELSSSWVYGISGEEEENERGKGANCIFLEPEPNRLASTSCIPVSPKLESTSVDVDAVE